MDLISSYNVFFFFCLSLIFISCKLTQSVKKINMLSESEFCGNSCNLIDVGNTLIALTFLLNSILVKELAKTKM